MNIESLYIHPIKSTNAWRCDEIIVDEIGFKNDRYYAIANSKNVVLTAREHPILLKVSSKIKGDFLTLYYQGKSIQISIHDFHTPIKLSLFKKEIYGKKSDSRIDHWISQILQETCTLVKIDFNNLRTTHSHKISFNDVYPIHLISTASVASLNATLNTPVEIHRFRPNIIVSGTAPFEEYSWDEIHIGSCTFKVVSKTNRCSLITINPINGKKDKKQEPLRTLAKETSTKGQANFGVYLIPTKFGTIQKSDVLKIKPCNNTKLHILPIKQK